MTNATPESAVVVPGSQATPTPAVSGATPGQPPSSAPIVLDDATVEKLIQHPKFGEAVNRLATSRHDKRIGKIETEIKSLREGTGSVQAVKQAVAELDAEQPAPAAPGRAPAQAQGDGFKQKSAELMAAYGIPVDDPEVVALAKAEVLSEADWYVKLAEIKTKRTAAPPATPGQMVVDAGGNSAGARSKDEKRADLSKQLKALMDAPGRKNVAEITRLQTEIRAQL